MGLFKDGSTRTSGTTTLDNFSNRSGAWRSLPGYDFGGTKINYVPYEVDSPGYKVEAGSTVRIGKGQHTVTYSGDRSVITSTYNQKDLTVKKVWVNYENIYHMWPEVLKIRLHQNGAIFGGLAELSDANRWMAGWESPSIEANGSSPPYVYTVRELDQVGQPIKDDSRAILPTGYVYTASYDSSSTRTFANPFKMTNAPLATKLRFRRTAKRNDLRSEPIDSAYKSVIRILDSKRTVYTQIALGNGEENRAIPMIPPKEGQSSSTTEIVSMEYTMSCMESQLADALLGTEDGDKVTAKPGDDTPIILINTPDHESYFHYTVSVTNAKGFADGEGTDFRPKSPLTKYHGSDNPQYMVLAFTSDCIAAFIEDRDVAHGQRKLERGDDLHG